VLLSLVSVATTMQGDMISLSKADKRKWSPFFLQRVTEALFFLRVNVKARAIKKREIYLLEWAIMAPLYELDPEPTLEEIKQELGITKIDFLVKTAGELQILGIIQSEAENHYSLTESGKKLYQQKKMISDPRIVNFPIFRETTSSEWFVGVDSIRDAEESELNDPSLNLPSYIPEEIITDHVNKLKKILKPQEEILDHEMDDINQVQVTLAINLFLTKEGVNLHVVEHPFGNKYTPLLNKILSDLFRREGLLKNYLTQFEEESPYLSSHSTQIHQIPADTQLFLSTDIRKVFNDFSFPKANWLITNISDSYEIVQNQRKKPRIIIYAIDNIQDLAEGRQNNSNTFFPSEVHIQANQTDISLPTNVILSEEKQVTLTNVEVDGGEIPLFLLKKDLSSRTERLALLHKILEKIGHNSLERNMALYYLSPTIENFRSLISTIPLERVENEEQADQMIKEIIGLQTNLEEEFADLKLNEELFDLIFQFYSWEKLVQVDHSIFLLNYESFFKQLTSLLHQKLEISLDSRWEVFLGSILEISTIYTRLQKIISVLTNKVSPAMATKIDSDFNSLLNQCLVQVEIFLKDIPNPPNVDDFETFFNELKAFNHSKISYTYLTHIKAKTKTDSSNFKPLELLTIQAFLGKNNLAPTNKELSEYVSKAMIGSTINFNEKNGLKGLQHIHSLVTSIDKNYSLSKSILKYVPKEIMGIDDQATVRNVITNLKELRLLIDKDADDYIKKTLRNTEKSLQPQSFSELEIWLLFLERTKTVLERSVGTTILKLNPKQIWNRTLPYLEEDIDREKRIRSSLGQLKMGSQLKKWRKEKIKEKRGENEEQTAQGIIPSPPLERIVVDGNNVVKSVKTGKKYSVKPLIQLYKELQQKYQFTKVVIFISAALKYDVDDFDHLKFLIQQKIIRETPAGESDDYFIIQFAIKDNALILTNDLFRDWKDKYPEMKDEIQKRRVTFMLDPKTQGIILGQYVYNEDE